MWIKAAGIVLGACLCFGLGVILFVITNQDTKIQKEENSSQAQTVEQQAVPAVKEEQKEMESDTGVKMEKAVVPEKIDPLSFLFDFYFEQVLSHLLLTFFTHAHSQAFNWILPEIFCPFRRLIPSISLRVTCCSSPDTLMSA